MKAWKKICWFRTCTIILFDPGLTLLKTELKTNEHLHSLHYRHHPKQEEHLPSSSWAWYGCSWKTPLATSQQLGTWGSSRSWSCPAMKAGKWQNTTNKRDAVRKSLADPPTPSPRIGKVWTYFLYRAAPLSWSIPGELYSIMCTLHP